MRRPERVLLAKLAPTTRSQRAATLVEGVVGLWLVVTCFVLAILLVLNISAVIFYKLKLACATNLTAAYASSLLVPSSLTWVHNQQVGADTSTLTPQVTQYATKVLSDMGLSGGTPPQINVTFDPIVADTLTATVSIKLTSLQLFGKGTVLPNFINLQDAAIGVSRYDQSLFLNQFMLFGTTGAGASLYMPGYGFPPGPVSGAAGRDVMKLRPFDTAPTIIKMGIPSPGYFNEAWSGSGVGHAVDLPAGCSHF